MNMDMDTTVIAALISVLGNGIILLVNLCFSKKSKEEQNKIAENSIEVQKEIANKNIDAKIRRQNKLNDIKEWTELSSELIEALNSYVDIGIKRIDNATTSVHYEGVSHSRRDYGDAEYKVFWQRNIMRYEQTMKNLELYEEYKFRVISLGQQLKMRLFNKETKRTDIEEKINELVDSTKCIDREFEDKQQEVLENGLTPEDTENFKDHIQKKTWENIESFANPFREFLKEELDTVTVQEENK